MAAYLVTLPHSVKYHIIYYIIELLQIYMGLFIHFFNTFQDQGNGLNKVVGQGIEKRIPGLWSVISCLFN